MQTTISDCRPPSLMSSDPSSFPGTLPSLRMPRSCPRSWLTLYASLTSRCSLLTAHCPLLTARYSLPLVITHYPPLYRAWWQFAHCSLLIPPPTHHPPLHRACWLVAPMTEPCGLGGATPISLPVSLIGWHALQSRANWCPKSTPISSHSCSQGIADAYVSVPARFVRRACMHAVHRPVATAHGTCRGQRSHCRVVRTVGTYTTRFAKSIGAIIANIADSVCLGAPTSCFRGGGAVACNT